MHYKSYRKKKEEDNSTHTHINSTSLRHFGVQQSKQRGGPSPSANHIAPLQGTVGCKSRC